MEILLKPILHDAQVDTIEHPDEFRYPVLPRGDDEIVFREHPAKPEKRVL